MDYVRTTIALDDDVFYAVKERARRERRSAGAVLSDLARQALSGREATDLGDDLEDVHGFVPFPHRGPLVTNDLIDALRDDGTE